MNYYERHIGDYLKDTAHLSLLEHGVYGRLLDVYYTREAGIPAVEVARLVGAKSKDERAALAVVLAEFFVADGDMLKQSRCDVEIERFKDKQRKAKASADARWSQFDRNANASAKAMRTHTEGNALQSPDTRPTTEAKASAERASRLPKPFTLPQEWAEWSRQERPDLDPLKVAAKFADFWHGKPGKAGTKLDWLATWRNWVREERAPALAPPPNSKTFRQQDEAAARAKASAWTGGLLGNDFDTLDMEPTDGHLALR